VTVELLLLLLLLLCIIMYYVLLLLLLLLCVILLLLVFVLPIYSTKVIAPLHPISNFPPLVYTTVLSKPFSTKSTHLFLGHPRGFLPLGIRDITPLTALIVVSGHYNMPKPMDPLISYYVDFNWGDHCFFQQLSVDLYTPHTRVVI